MCFNMRNRYEMSLEKRTSKYNSEIKTLIQRVEIAERNEAKIIVSYDTMEKSSQLRENQLASTINRQNEYIQKLQDSCLESEARIIVANKEILVCPSNSIRAYVPKEIEPTRSDKICKS